MADTSNIDYTPSWPVCSIIHPKSEIPVEFGVINSDYKVAVSQSGTSIQNAVFNFSVSKQNVLSQAVYVKIPIEYSFRFTAGGTVRDLDGHNNWC